MARVWHLRPRSADFPAPPICQSDNDISEAKAAQRDAGLRFIEVAHQGPEIRRVVSELRGRRIRNGFFDQIEDAWSRRNPESR